MPPGNRRIDGDGLIHARVHSELHILIEDVVIELPPTVRTLGPFDHRPFDHVRIIRPGRMHRVRGDVFAAGIGVQLQVLLQESLMLGGPGLKVIVPCHDPGVLP